MKLLPFEEKWAKFIKDRLGDGNIKRAAYLLLSWTQAPGFMGEVSRTLSLIRDMGEDKPSWSRNKKIKDNFVSDDIYHLNSQEIFLNHKNREILYHIRVCIRFLAEGKLVKTMQENDWNDRARIYYYYEYVLGDGISIYLVKCESEAEGTHWMDHVFSTENSIERLRDVFQKWFWETTQNNVYFAVKAMGTSKVLAPVMQKSLADPDPFIGKFGPEEVYEYWQDFARVGIPRSLLFIGHPGTGKTTTVRGIASKYNLKLARIDTDALAELLDEDSFTTWYELFNPNLILIDDIHGIAKNSALAIVLSILEHISNSIHIDTIVVGTANKLENVDLALRRPGRFDSVFSFTSDGYEGDILDLYAEKYDCVNIVAPKRNWLIKKFKELTPAYMKEIVKNIAALNHRDDIWDFLDERMKLMVKLADDKSDPDEALGGKEKGRLGFQTNDNIVRVQPSAKKKPRFG
jgi:hypothetical protein